MTYRKDVDGMRAVAVLAVVLYHAGLPGMPGGFTGVDVFFVISGYLITGILVKDHARGRFSLWTFYERRIRRIFPALFAVLIFTVLAGMALLLPPDLERLGASVLATTGFVSNIWFWSETGYFASSAESQPLLHTWSLAVEEQFYIVFPLILIGALSLNARRIGGGAGAAGAAGAAGGEPQPNMGLAVGFIAGLTLISFSIAQWTVMQDRDLAFYWPHTRAWELLAGALVAMNAFPVIQSARVREAVSALGLLLIIGSVTLLDSSVPFPGWSALPSVLGATLIIYAGHGQARRDDGMSTEPTMVERFLSLPFMIWIGLISYSLYLWHWPIFVLAAETKFIDLGIADGIVLIAVSIVMAHLSWAYIEQPFRKGQAGPKTPSTHGKPAAPSTMAMLGLQAAASGGATQRYFSDSRAIFNGAAVTIFVALVAGILMAGTGGLPGRFSPEVLTLAKASEDYNPRRDDCLELEPFHLAAGEACRMGPGKAGGMDETKNNPDFLPLGHPDVPRPRLLYWGDSHADALMPAFDMLAEETATPALAATYPGCPPMLGVTILGGKINHRCAGYNAEMLRLVDAYDIRRVVLVARWASYAFGIPDFGDKPRKHFLGDVGFEDPLSELISMREGQGTRVAGLVADDTRLDMEEDFDPRAMQARAAELKRRRARQGPPKSDTPRTTEASKVVFQRAFQRTIDALVARGVEIWIVKQVPYPARHVPLTLAKATARGLPVAGLEPRRAAQEARFAFTHGVIDDAVAKHPGITVVDVMDAMCDDERCRLIGEDGASLYYDDDHLSVAGAKSLAPLFRGVFEGLE